MLENMLRDGFLPKCAMGSWHTQHPTGLPGVMTVEALNAQHADYDNVCGRVGKRHASWDRGCSVTFTPILPQSRHLHRGLSGPRHPCSISACKPGIARRILHMQRKIIDEMLKAAC